MLPANFLLKKLWCSMRFAYETIVNASLEHAFAFFSRPKNLESLMSGRTSFRLMKCDELLRIDGELWVEETVLGILPIAMGFRFVGLDRPKSFAEQMIHGPFELFEHRHVFEAKGEATMLRDEIECRLKWPYGGELATRLLVARALSKMFAYRSGRIDSILNDKRGPKQ